MPEMITLPDRDEMQRRLKAVTRTDVNPILLRLLLAHAGRQYTVQAYALCLNLVLVDYCKTIGDHGYNELIKFDSLMYQFALALADGERLRALVRKAFEHYIDWPPRMLRSVRPG